MKHRHTPFRRVLDQMAHDLTEAVLDAVRQATHAALQGEAPSFPAEESFASRFTSTPVVSGASQNSAAPSVAEQLTVLPEVAAARSTPVSRSSKQGAKAPSSLPRSRSKSRPAARVVASTGRFEPADEAIADEPNDAMIIDPISMLAALESAAVREPAPQPRDMGPAPSILRDAEARDEGDEDDAAPARPAARSGATFAPRTGEEVIRTGSAGLVLRRRRSSASPTA